MPAIDMLAMGLSLRADRRGTKGVRGIPVTPNLAALPAGFPGSVLLAALVPEHLFRRLDSPKAGGGPPTDVK